MTQRKATILIAVNLGMILILYKSIHERTSYFIRASTQSDDIHMRKFAFKHELTGQHLASHSHFYNNPASVCNTDNSFTDQAVPPMFVNISELLIKLRQQIVPYPDEYFEGRGIVLTTGYSQASIDKTNLKMIELTGTQLPVEIWYSSLQRSHDSMLELLRQVPKLNASVCCFETAQCQTLTRTRNLDVAHVYKPLQWSLLYRSFPYKPAAIISATFAEVLFLDCDAYLVRDPEYLFRSDPMYLHFGALFYPDAVLSRQHPALWNLLNTTCAKDEFEFESSVILVDKTRVWKGLYMTKLMNDHHQVFYGPASDGDKDTFRLAFRYMHVKYYLVMIPCSSGTFNGTHFSGYTLCKTDSLAQHIYAKYINSFGSMLFICSRGSHSSHIHLFKYLSMSPNASALRYTRIGLGDPNNHSFVFQHCSTSAGPYTFHIERVSNRTQIGRVCMDRQMVTEEIENHTYAFDESLMSDRSRYDRVILTETNNLMPSFLKHYFQII